MKTHPLLAIIATSIFLALGSAPNLFAQTPGGFSGVSEKDAEALAAAKAGVAAHDAKLTFVAIEKVERQVVAGLNYRLRLKVSEGAKIRMADAVVWRKLDGKHQLTSWKWVDAAPVRTGE